MDNTKLPINQIITRINDAAANDEAMALTSEEVKILSKGIGDKFFIPVYTNEQIVQLVKEGKLGQKIVNTKD
ncbi:hypothetical protein QUG64_03215 [Acinetobacter lwoffii]|uniref:Uncharacterized protein n=1 Tax=Acinetobacter lwoffii NCTC 5866 = CIP 64.10 = NIPH 512 TaxID=981327 RepID=A0ABP2ZET6_ACILW|nr:MULTISPECIES: hypothetical protein [Acinetobacter]ENU16682.1 hypothetical protein F995_02167 [Acinetobacter sp. CIP A162]ESJ96037.1 hypothetical protein P800_00859 [Acinetobacter lwoffii NCTC 5866 = CIP 64.10 = NIPH 512]QXB40449.1 hypothetical protein I6L23_14955 [Acinetobacter lwoffii]SUU30299.1 Uncharacterised protein [Acinetobacter lwoffii]VFQ38463.1 Uncharacterised protein [Acinetobacter lwoffii]